MDSAHKLLRNIILFILFVLLPCWAGAQSMLSRKITINVKQQPVKDVLDIIGRQGEFYFSYNSGLNNTDSLVSVKAINKTVKQVLDMIFGDAFQYKEVDNHIVIQQTSKEKVYVISGHITDQSSGGSIKDASIFERNELLSVLSNDQGYFRLKLKAKDKHSDAVITISKSFYNDTTILIKPGYDQELNIVMVPDVYSLSEVEINQYSQVEHSWFGNFFLSSRQRVQSINLSKFFVDRPYQFSLTPGLGTHGKMSAQVVNKFSFNILGGYSAGVNGFELASVFNITKKESKYFQLAGVFNLTGSYAKGVQVAGAVNVVGDSMRGIDIAGLASIVSANLGGIQITGLYSRAGGEMKGLQIGGVASRTGSSVKGVQLAGLANTAGGNMNGLQIAGAVNIVKGDVKGAQLSGLLNSAKRLDGVQIGLINVADTSTGYSIGLINIVHKGYHRLAVYADELQDLNVDYKSGNSNMYNLISAGANIGARKSIMLGYGIGHEFIFSHRLSLAAEAVEQNYYLGAMSRIPVQGAARFNINIRLSHDVTLFAGPRFCAQFTSVGESPSGYHTDVPANSLKVYNGITGWVGWDAGLSFF